MWENIIPEPIRLLWYALTGQQSPRQQYADANLWLYWTDGYRFGASPEVIGALLSDGPPPPRFRYRHFTVPKKDGSPREIVEPGVDLKKAQRYILRRYLNKATPHPAAVGYRSGKSIADHAWAHAGAAIIITADIQDFFPSTRRERVQAWWEEYFGPKYAGRARLMTRLTTYQGGLPQGAPTSPALSNLVNFKLDEYLFSLTRGSGGTYTRYVDDLVFSWPEGQSPPPDFEHSVRAALRREGYRLNRRKGWCVYLRDDEPTITGLILTKRRTVDIPKPMKRQMRKLARSRDPEAKVRLRGYKAFRDMVVKPHSRRIAKQPSTRPLPQRTGLAKCKPPPYDSCEAGVVTCSFVAWFILVYLFIRSLMQLDVAPSLPGNIVGLSVIGLVFTIVVGLFVVFVIVFSWVDYGLARLGPDKPARLAFWLSIAIVAMTVISAFWPPPYGLILLFCFLGALATIGFVWLMCQLSSPARVPYDPRRPRSRTGR